MSKETKSPTDQNADLSKIAPGKTMIISPRDISVGKTGKTGRPLFDGSDRDDDTNRDHSK